MANCKHRRIKRPMNAFLVYARTHRPILSKTCPNATAAEITLKLGIEWRKLSDEQKVPYFAESLRLKWEHQQQFPGEVNMVNRSIRSTLRILGLYYPI